MKNIIASMAILLLVGCATNQQPAEVVASPKSTKVVPLKNAYYQIKKGDTVASVAKRFGISTADLLKLNKLKDDAQLVPGQRLLVKARGNQTEQKLTDDITVKSLDDVSATSADSVNTVGDAAAPDMLQTSDASSVIASPNSGYQSPVPGKIIKAYGKLPDGSVNKGINIAAPKGVPVKAVADGVVKYAGSQAEGYGKLVMIQHSDGRISTYAHLNSIDVKTKAVVAAGSKIGTVGSTGSVSQPQLHLQIRGSDKSPIDPATLIAGIG
jgi:murein DD-endopeptidase MepM/ murein hydrolase activator NlpD